MASPRFSSSKWLTAATLLLLFFATVLPSKPVVLGFPKSSDDEALKQKKMVLGSRPPLCINKCFKCRPCKATLVIPPHRKGAAYVEEDDTYYLLAWKCRCGNKIYHP